MFQFRVLPFSLNIAPRVFSKLLECPGVDVPGRLVNKCWLYQRFQAFGQSYTRHQPLKGVPFQLKEISYLSIPQASMARTPVEYSRGISGSRTGKSSAMLEEGLQVFLRPFHDPETVGVTRDLILEGRKVFASTGHNVLIQFPLQNQTPAASKSLCKGVMSRLIALHQTSTLHKTSG